MEEFIKLLGTKYPSILDAKQNVLSFIKSAKSKYPELNEEDLQQLVLMMGVDQGEIPEEDYQTIVANRETPSNIPMEMTPESSDVSFDGLKQFLGKR